MGLKIQCQQTKSQIASTLDSDDDRRLLAEMHPYSFTMEDDIDVDELDQLCDSLQFSPRSWDNAFVANLRHPDGELILEINYREELQSMWYLSYICSIPPGPSGRRLLQILDRKARQNGVSQIRLIDESALQFDRGNPESLQVRSLLLLTLLAKKDSSPATYYSQFGYQWAKESDITMISEAFRSIHFRSLVTIYGREQVQKAYHRISSNYRKEIKQQELEAMTIPEAIQFLRKVNMKTAEGFLLNLMTLRKATEMEVLQKNYLLIKIIETNQNIT